MLTEHSSLAWGFVRTLDTLTTEGSIAFPGDEGSVGRERRSQPLRRAPPVHPRRAEIDTIDRPPFPDLPLAIDIPP